MFSHPIGHVFDVTDDTISSPVRHMDPKDLLGKLFVVPCSGRRDKVSKVFLPTCLAHPLFILALELRVGRLQAVGTSEPEQLPQTVHVRHIKGAVGDGRERHEQHENQNDQSPRQGLRQGTT